MRMGIRRRGGGEGRDLILLLLYFTVLNSSPLLFCLSFLHALACFGRCRVYVFALFRFDMSFYEVLYVYHYVCYSSFGVYGLGVNDKRNYRIDYSHKYKTRKYVMGFHSKGGEGSQFVVKIILRGLSTII